MTSLVFSINFWDIWDILGLLWVSYWNWKLRAYELKNTFSKSLKDPENATYKIYRKLLSKTHKLSFLTLAEYLKRLRMRGGVNLNFIPWTRIRLRLGKVFIQQVTTRISPLSNTLWLPPVPKILSSVFTVSKYTRLLKRSCITHLHVSLYYTWNEIMFDFVNDKVWW